jgi:hypothetical protein
MTSLFDNLWAKLFALLIGVLIWFHVATEKNYNYEVHLPVTRVDLKENLTLVHALRDTIYVTVSATGKQLLREKWVQQGVRLNAPSLPVGDHKLTLSPSNVFLAENVSGIRIHEIISPATVQVAIDDQFVARVKVAPDIEAGADIGFAVAKEIEVEPEQVTVVGPRTAIKELKSLTTDKRLLTGLRTDAVIRLAVVHPDNIPLRIAPDSVTATVRVAAVKTRTYDSLTVVVFNAPTDATVSTDPAKVTVDLAGSPDKIDLLNRNALTVSVDYRLQSAAGKARIKVDCPSGFRVARLSVDSVMIVESK